MLPRICLALVACNTLACAVAPSDSTKQQDSTTAISPPSRVQSTSAAPATPPKNSEAKGPCELQPDGCAKQDSTNLRTSNTQLSASPTESKADRARRLCAAHPDQCELTSSGAMYGITSYGTRYRINVPSETPALSDRSVPAPPPLYLSIGLRVLSGGWAGLHLGVSGDSTMASLWDLEVDLAQDGTESRLSDSTSDAMSHQGFRVKAGYIAWRKTPLPLDVSMSFGLEGSWSWKITERTSLIHALTSDRFGQKVWLPDTTMNSFRTKRTELASRFGLGVRLPTISRSWAVVANLESGFGWSRVEDGWNDLSYSAWVLGDPRWSLGLDCNF